VRPRCQGLALLRGPSTSPLDVMATPHQNLRIIVASAASLILTLAGFYCFLRAFSADAPIRLVIAAVAFWGLSMWVALYVHRLFTSTHPRAEAMPSNNRWRGP
jgi:hypothetical protein